MNSLLNVVTFVEGVANEMCEADEDRLHKYDDVGCRVCALSWL